MPGSLKNDDKGVRLYILSDVLRKIPIDKSYNDLCGILGNDAIAFYDFQYWYYRFLSGKQDLDFDRSSEPERLQFSDLPVDAVGLIVNKLKVVERLVLRRVSKPLREFIEKRMVDCTNICVSCRNNLINVSYDNGEILYAKNEETVKLYELYAHVGEALVIGDDYDSEAVNDLACVLKNPKLQLGYLDISTIWLVADGELSKFFDKLNVALKSLKHQISVRRLTLQPEHPNNVLEILPYLKPGYLKEIIINNKIGMLDWKSIENTRKVEQIMQLEQWKQAKDLDLIDTLRLFPDEVLLQFKSYYIKTISLSQNELNRIGMKFAASPVFEHCCFAIREPSRDFIDFIGVPGPFDEDYRSVRHYMIPNTDKLLVFKEYESGTVMIEKKTREVL